ncbi:MAG: hypothetical protein BGO69_04945 [Bacteroidetes bacterium 46-16]|nr:MAG: hypothetical protein BGO69_04945 [Bacteroidetes bacterium 46-16]
MNTDLQTEQIILNAARALFTRKGFAAVRLQDIADEAGINRTLLHYYFRTKEKLFEKIFTEAIEQVFPNVQEILNSNEPLLSKIEQVISHYIDFAIAHPYLPTFVIHELNQNPDKIPAMLGNMKQKPELGKFMMEIQHAAQSGIIRPIQPIHLLINIISLCLFPFIAKPMMHAILGITDPVYAAFIAERKKVVTETIINSIKIPNS